MSLNRFIVFLLLLAGVTAWLTQGWWLSPFLVQSVQIEQGTLLIRVAKVFVNTLILGLNIVLILMLIATRYRERGYWDQEMESLRRIKPTEIRRRLGWGGQVNWIDRGATQVGGLQTYGRIAITGRTKLGKTREALELIRRAIAVDLIRADQIYELGQGFRFISAENLPTALRYALNRQLPALLFLDDLPYHFTTAEALEQLTLALLALEDCKELYIVITIGHDQMAETHQTWLEQQQFHKIELSDLNEDQTRLLVDRAIAVFGLQGDEMARSEFVKGRDGTPETILTRLRCLRMEGITQIDQMAARLVARESMTDSWEKSRRLIRRQMRATLPLLDALEDFHAAGVTPYAAMVLHYAAYLWRQQSWWRRPRRPLAALKKALAFLAFFDVVVSQGKIVYPEPLVNGLNAPAVAREHLGRFLARHKRPFHGYGLRWLNRGAELQRLALLDLALTAYHQGGLIEAIRFYTLALQVCPHFEIYIGRGKIYAEIGNTQRGLKDYSQAIRLNPEYAAAYYNRGDLYAELDDYRRAKADYNKAAKLNPEYASLYYSRGTTYFDQGDFEQAQLDISEAIRLNPEDATAYYNRGNAYAELGDYENALADYDEAIRLNLRYAAAYNNRATTYLRQGDYERARTDYSEAIRLDPKYPRAFYGRGTSYFEQGNYERALADYSQVIRLNPEDAAAYNNRGNSYFALDDFEHALADYSQAILLNPQDPASYYNRGNTYLKQGDYEHALADFSQTIRLNPEDAPAYYNRGLTYHEQGDYQRARADYNEAIRLNPEYADVHNYWDGSGDENEREQAQLTLNEITRPTPAIAEAQANLPPPEIKQEIRKSALIGYSEVTRPTPKIAGIQSNQKSASRGADDPKQTLADYSEAIRLNPDDAAAYYNRGTTYAAQGDYERALADYSRAIRLNPADADVYSNRGTTYFELHDHERALSDYSEAVRLNPKDEIAYNYRGTTYAAQGNYQRAVSDYSQAIRINPRYAAAYNNRGTAYLEQRNYQQALADYGEAIRLNSKDATAFNNRGNVYARQKFYERALSDYGQAIRLNPNYAAAYNNRGNIYAQKGDYERALADYNEANRINPEDAATVYNLACIDALQNRPDQVLLKLQQAFQLDQDRGSSHHIQLAQTDSDLASMRRDPRFRALLAEFSATRQNNG